MKKIIIAMLCFSFLLTGCGEDKKEVTLKINEEYKISDELSLMLTNVSTEKQVIVHNTQEEDFDYQYPNNDKGIFLDIQLNIKNLSKETITIDEDFATEITINKEIVKEENMNYFLEIYPYDTFIDNTKLRTSSEGILHIAAIINEKDVNSKFTCTVTYGNTIFTIDVDTNLNKNIIKRGSLLTSKDKYEITIEDVYMNPTLEPSNIEGEYEYFEPNTITNRFVIAKTVIKNNSSEILNRKNTPDTIFILDNSYEATYAYQEKDSGAGFEEDISIPANSSKKIYYLLEVDPAKTFASDLYYQVRIDKATHTLNVKES